MFAGMTFVFSYIFLQTFITYILLKKVFWNYVYIHTYTKVFSILFFQGYRSGYVYKQPLVKEEPPKPKSDVELPAAVSSLGYLLEEENLYKDG